MPSSLARPSIGVAIIAKDAGATIDACLKSIKPYVSQIVVCVDERSTDRTRQIAKRNGAETYPVKVSDWHECALHGRVLAQHFGNARQDSFTHLDPDLDWWLWIDADDVVKGGEWLANLCEQTKADPDVLGVWFPYDYASIESQGKSLVNTEFHRERLLRTHRGDTQIGWKWISRVHETVSPEGIEGKWSFNNQVRIVHQPGTHQTPASAMRNLLLLEIDYEQDENNQRTVFYLGNQHFAMDHWEEAIYWYERLTGGLGSNPYELWQAYVYMAHAYMKLQNPEGAWNAVFGALRVRPEHPEPYFQAALICRQTGESEKALHWIKLGRQMKIPPPFVFKNPLDYSFNNYVTAGEALYDLGMITPARQEWQHALAVFPDERLLGAVRDVQKREADIEIAQSFVELAGQLDGMALELYKALPDDVKAYGRTRDIAVPMLIKEREKSERHIEFYCGNSWEPWYPGSINTTGIGGSETAVIEIAKRFAADGWTVDVFNNADRYEGYHDGVGYWDVNRADWISEAEVHVSWRQPMMAPHPHAKKNVLWCHDLNYGPDAAYGFTQKWDVIAGVSEWHAGMLKRYYGVDAVSLPNGINLERFADAPKKVPFRCVYASSTDRGLVTLLQIWPHIVKAEPTAELHIAYGWETIDRMIASGQRPGLAEFKADVERLIADTPNVVWRGRLNQQDLAQLYGESVAWLYPTDFLEVSCCVGNTLIDMPRDYTKYPRGVPISELVGQSDFPVWSYDEAAGRFVLSRAKWVAKTGVLRSICKVTWDDGTILRATADHRVLTYKRGWVELKDLQPGESAVALRKHAAIQVSVGDGPWPQEHRVVAEWALGPIPNGYHVDHKDGNPFNNESTNLQFLSPAEHARKTFTGLVHRASSHRVAIEKWREKWDSDDEFRKDRIAHLRSQGKKMWDWVNALPEIERREWIRKRALRKRESILVKNPAYNHKVVSVEPDGYEDVYDMEVERTHNFVAGGVVIHNCISSMEAMAGGAVPITTMCGALPETINSAGLLVPGPTTSRPYWDTFHRVAMGVLGELNTQTTYSQMGRERAKELTWDHAYRRWLVVLGYETEHTVHRLPGGKPRRTRYRNPSNVGPVVPAGVIAVA